MNRNLSLLWVGQFVSQLGDQLLRAVLVFLVFAINPGPDAGSRAGLVQLAMTLPFLLFSPAAGVLADRMDRRRLMILSDLARAAVLFAIPVVWHFGALNWVTLGAAAFLVATFSTAFAPARDAIVPELAEGDSVVRVNALLQSSTNVAMLAGLLIAALVLGVGQDEGESRGAGEGVMVALVGANGGTMLFSLVCLAAIAVPAKAVTHVAPASATAGLVLAMKSPLLRTLLFLTAVDNFFIMGPALVGSAMFIQRTLGLKAWHLALFDAALAAGWFAGTMAVSRVASKLPKGATILVGMFLDGITYVPFFWIRSFPLACIAVFVHGLSIPLITVPRTSFVQERVDPGQRAQVFSLVQLTVVGFTSLSCAASGWLGDRFGAPALFLGAGLGAMVGLAGVFSRELREAK